MRVLILCVGSRGDAEPFCALASKLSKGGHSVDFFLQPELATLAPVSEKITVHQLPFTQFDFYKYTSTPTHGQDSDNPRVKFVGIIADVIAELVLPCTSKVLETAKDNQIQVIVTSSLARNVGFLVSDKLSIPFCLIHLQSLVPTAHYPHYSSSEECVKVLTESSSSDGLKPKSSYLESYLNLERHQYEFLQERLDKVYRDFGMNPLSLENVMERLQGRHSITALCNAYSSQLHPHVTNDTDNVGPYVYEIGALADRYVPDSFDPESSIPADLREFLKKNKPICVGYGSMPFGRVTELLEALESTGRHVVLVGDALKIPEEWQENEWIQSHVQHVSSLPYAWLLPQCCMMLSHGGAGVVHATLGAGIPAVISPLMGDQFFFAELLKAKGLGARAGPSLTTVTKEDFVDSIQTALQCIRKAKEYGELVRASPAGVDRLVEILCPIAETGSVPERN